MAAIPDSIKIKLEVDTTELDEVINNLKSQLISIKNKNTQLAEIDDVNDLEIILSLLSTINEMCNIADITIKNMMHHLIISKPVDKATT